MNEKQWAAIICFTRQLTIYGIALYATYGAHDILFCLAIALAFFESLLLWAFFIIKGVAQWIKK